MGTKSLPAGTLATGAEGIKNAISTFEQARKADLENEKLPPLKLGMEEPTLLPAVFGAPETDIPASPVVATTIVPDIQAPN
ncbi:3',5'-cyclic-nucleotide phosphodiesterase (PDEase) (3':5'-CNP) [Cladochytrium tenue]|nr:3',5'-cyclic-nucleotide phosphodiesterase (PDEase) (3':5'-CNP) [Cladochytrium tenue]